MGFDAVRKPPIPRSEFEDLQSAVIDIYNFAREHNAPQQTLEVLRQVRERIQRTLDQYDVMGEF